MSSLVLAIPAGVTLFLALPRLVHDSKERFAEKATQGMRVSEFFKFKWGLSGMSQLRYVAILWIISGSSAAFQPLIQRVDIVAENILYLSGGMFLLTLLIGFAIAFKEILRLRIAPTFKAEIFEVTVQS